MQITTGMVRDAELEPEEPEHAADKALGLTQDELEDQPPASSMHQRP